MLSHGYHPSIVASRDHVTTPLCVLAGNTQDRGYQPTTASRKDHCAPSVDDDAMLAMPLYRTCQHAVLDVAANGDIIFRRQGMGHPLHRLLDDRAFIQITRNVMGRCPDQLDAPVMRLGIGIGALEAG